MNVKWVDKTCIVAECETKIHCRGYCKKHYNRVQRHGDPTIVKGSGPKRLKEGGRRWVQTFRQENSELLFGICPGCKEENDLVFDHDHSCCEYGCPNCFRDFICASCNHTLGYSKDSPETLRRLASYLEKSLLV